MERTAELVFPLWKVFVGVVAFIFVNRAELYLAISALVLLDTLTGVSAAIKRGTFNSRSMRIKTMSKILSYVVTLAAVGLVYRVVEDAVFLSDLANLFGYIVASSIAVTELVSIIENVRSITDRKVFIFRSQQEILDYLEANHVISTVQRRELDGRTD